MTLPPRSNGEPLALEAGGGRQIVIVGANGAGKTRFAREMARQIGAQAFRVSALNALYGDTDEHWDTSVKQMYAAQTGAGLMRSDLRTDFERMMALLLHREMAELLRGKWLQQSGQDAGQPSPGPSQLDTLVKLWREVFPRNQVLVEAGRVLFARQDTDDAYPQASLSAGEKAVMYYIGACLLAPSGATVFVDAPEMFLHPSSTRLLWDRIEGVRRDCAFVYVTHDLAFPATRADAATVWVKNYDPGAGVWEYDLVPSDGDSPLSEEMYLAILGARKPVLFIEGDALHSYDAKLYPLIFREYTVKPLGGCDRVIEATRSFNSLSGFHNLDAAGIVDRDRRDDHEVDYLRQRKIFVPDVAEVENIFMLEEVVRAVAATRGRDEDTAFAKVRRNLLRLFEADLKRQALEHVRHRIKRSVEHRIDGKFPNINALEQHLSQLPGELGARAQYEALCRQFRSYVSRGDYGAVLRVYNRKSMLSESHVAEAAGIRSDDKKAYIRAVLAILADDGPQAPRLRAAVRRCFGFEAGREGKGAQ